MAPTDLELVAAARAGNQDAFGTLYGRHQGSVRAGAKRILPADEVEDACQETFLKAFTRLDTFQETSSFKTWLLRIAARECLLALRRRRRSRTHNMLELSADGEEDDLLGRYIFGTRDHALDALPARLDLGRLLRILPVGQRRVFEMAYLEELPDGEIAQHLGVSLLCVKSRLYHARRRLRLYGGPSLGNPPLDSK